MNILMVTNTFTPHVGGVAKSVQAFSAAYVSKGHDVWVVAPEFEDMPEDERNVVRVPAVQRFNGSDFSVRIPIPFQFNKAFGDFRPDIVHSHHPFMLGSTALHLAQKFRVPLVFTHHTMYERYTHYVPGDSPAMQRFAVALATGYANLCNHVIAPSESTAAELRKRGVETPITAIPTGVDVERFAQGDGGRQRKKLNVPDDAFVVGHIGRLAPEKNLPFLAASVCDFMKTQPNAHFLLAGEGPSLAGIEATFEQAGLMSRYHHLGRLTGGELADAYAAMNVFAFASFTETQGMVLTEAMAAGVPVVAIDAPGAREVVIDEVNGRLLPTEDAESFVQALTWIAERDPAECGELKQAAFARAHEFSMDATSDRALTLYEAVRAADVRPDPEEGSPWENALERLETEWRILANAAEAAGAALGLSGSDSKSGDV
jgi:glycosyltransferase involved in cell wall biosynthesis